jgi:hypothetical protein
VRYPGQVFALTELDYPAQMRAYASQRQAKRQGQRKTKPRVHPVISAERAAWISRMEALRSEHRRQRWAAQASARAWRQVWQAHRQQQADWRQLLPDEKCQRQAQRTTSEATF